MVDFDNETTVGVPAKEVMKIYLLQTKAYTEDLYRLYRKSDYSGVDKGLAEVRASLEQWFIIMERLIFRHWLDKEIKKEDILTIIEKGSKKDLLNLIIKFNIVLDNSKITRLDTKKANKKTWEASNIEYGY